MDLPDRHMADRNPPMGDLGAPLTTPVERLTSLPGVGTTAARVMLAEIGTDRSRVGADTRLAPWAGMCPGTDERAGERRRGRTRQGHRYLRRVLAPCAWAARNTPTYVGRTFRRLDARLGGRKAAVAVGHQIFAIVYHLLAGGSFDDEERDDRLQPRQLGKSGLLIRS
jgi:transposase